MPNAYLGLQSKSVFRVLTVLSCLRTCKQWQIHGDNAQSEPPPLFSGITTAYYEVLCSADRKCRPTVIHRFQY